MMRNRCELDEWSPTMGDAIAECLKGFIAKELEVNLDVDHVDVETPLFEGGLELDSFAVVELIALIEAHYGFEFSEDDFCAPHFENIDTLAQLVASKIDR